MLCTRIVAHMCRDPLSGYTCSRRFPQNPVFFFQCSSGVALPPPPPKKPCHACRPLTARGVARQAASEKVSRYREAQQLHLRVSCYTVQLCPQQSRTQLCVCDPAEACQCKENLQSNLSFSSWGFVRMVSNQRMGTSHRTPPPPLPRLNDTHLADAWEKCCRF